MSAEPPFEITRDTLLQGRVTLLQPRRGHRAGTDAVLLAAAADPKPGETGADLGAATGAVALILLAREPGLGMVLAERDPDLAGLARENLLLNGVSDRARVAEIDLLAGPAARLAAGLPSGGFDLVVTNPPFVESGDAPRSPETRRASAHELPPGGFARWVGACADLLRHRGRLTLVQRADRLDICLEELRRAFGAIRIRPVQAKADTDAIRVLITAVRGARTPVALAPALVLHGPDGGFTPLAAALHHGEALPP